MRQNSSEKAQVRVGPLTNIARVLSSLGSEPEPVFAAAGFTCDDFTDTEHRIDFQAGDALLAECVRVTGCEHFGILLGQWALSRHLGLVAEVSNSAASVGVAIADIVALLDLHDTGGIAALDGEGNRCSFSYGLHAEGLQAPGVIYDLAAVMLCNIMRGLCGMGWGPISVYLTRSRPEDYSPYRRALRGQLHFNATATSIAFNRDLLEKVPHDADQARHSALQRDAQGQHQALHGHTAVQARDHIRRGLILGSSDIAYVAAAMKLHERTLSRRLGAEGTSYREQLDYVRFAVGQHYLAGTDLTISDIAYALGYSSTAAFDHAFKRWATCAPGTWRQEFARNHEQRA